MVFPEYRGLNGLNKPVYIFFLLLVSKQVSLLALIKCIAIFILSVKKCIAKIYNCIANCELRYVNSRLEYVRKPTNMNIRASEATSSGELQIIHDP